MAAEVTPRAGRVIAWFAFALGIAVSVAGNILHSAITPAGLGELVGAAFWPLALMLSIEILTRVRWQSGKRWMGARVVGLFLVGLVAAVLSYRHLAGLMTSWGEDWFNAHLGPLAVDGLMLLAATALLSISREPAAVTAPVVVEAEEHAPVELPPPAPPPAVVEKPADLPSRLHIVNQVSDSDAVEAARQAWIQSDGTLSSSKVADMLGVSKSTAHRRYTSKWVTEQRIVR
jgi:hypothetical protein